MAVPDRVTDGYPDSFGAKRAAFFPVFGPVLYAAYTAPTTGGQDVEINGPSGLKTVDVVFGAVSRSGLYRAEVVQYEAASVRGITVARAKIILKWYVVATGDEAGAIDLSAEIVDLFAIGPK